MCFVLTVKEQKNTTNKEDAEEISHNLIDCVFLLALILKLQMI